MRVVPCGAECPSPVLCAMSHCQNGPGRAIANPMPAPVRELLNMLSPDVRAEPLYGLARTF